MAIDWAAINELIGEIRPTVRATLDFVTEEAAAADEKIGAEIAEHTAANVPNALAILEVILKAVENKTLTVEIAKAQADKLREHLAKTREHLKPTVQKLPAPVAEKIRVRLDETKEFVGTITQKVGALLSQ